MIVEIQATGERVEAVLLPRDVSTPLSVTLGQSGRVIYVLASMLDGGWWRIVEATPTERAVLRASSIVFDET